MEIKGFINPRYQSIAEAFLKDFEQKEIGASMCMYHKNELVIDVWSGYRDLNNQKPWDENTVVPIFSATKAIASTCMAICHSRGLFSYDDKISKYWPEFAQNGKKDITIAQLLKNQAGLSAVDTKLDIETIMDRELIENIIAKQKPLWNAGDYQGYHCWTFGWYVSALLSKIDPQKRRLKEFVDQEITPHILGEVRVGIDQSYDLSKIASIKSFSKLSGLFAMPFAFVQEFFKPWSLTFKSMLNPSFLSNHSNFNKSEVLQLEIGSGGGIGNARGLASLLDALSNPTHKLFLKDETLNYITQKPTPPKKSTVDLVFKQEAFTFQAGYMKPTEKHDFSPNSKAFGGFGAGGCFVFSDVENNFTIAYTMNKMSHEMMNMPQEVQIRNAVYQNIKNK
jgi:CubicO group peptidase (beta-lactamase class C family)